MIKLSIKRKKQNLQEADFKGDRNIGLLIVQSDNIHEFIYLNLSNFAGYLSKFEPNKKHPGRIFPGLEKYDKTNPIVIGILSLKDTSSDGPCFNAMKVAHVANHRNYSGIGFGKEMYKIAMAYAALYDRPIRPDISGPRPSAQNVWASLEKDEDVSKTFDNKGRPAEDGDGLEYMDYETPKRTPAKIDDCHPNKASREDNFLNRAYFSGVWINSLEVMENRAKKFLYKHFVDPQSTHSHLKDLADDLFNSRYHNK